MVFIERKDISGYFSRFCSVAKFQIHFANVPANFDLLAHNIYDLAMYMCFHQTCTTVYGDGDYIG